MGWDGDYSGGVWEPLKRTKQLYHGMSVRWFK